MNNKLRLIDSARMLWAHLVTAVKSGVMHAHFMSGVQIVDQLSELAAKATISAEQLSDLVTLLPVPTHIRDEVYTLLAEAAPLLQKAKNKTLIDGIKHLLAAEVINIISGNVHDINQIKTDIATIFSTELIAA